MRRHLIALALLTAALPALADNGSKPPAGLQPLPDVPPPPADGLSLDPALEPQITIVKRGSDTVEDYRINGRLYMRKITPAHGVPYYEIDQRGDGQFSRQDHLDSGVRVPQWAIFQF